MKAVASLVAFLETVEEGGVTEAMLERFGFPIELQKRAAALGLVHREEVICRPYGLRHKYPAGFPIVRLYALITQ
jgi:hypothetical protein